MARPTELIQPLGMQEVAITPGLRHGEIYTMRGLIGLQWHGPPDAERIVVACPGGMGGCSGRGEPVSPALGQAPGRARDRDGGRRLPAPVRPRARAVLDAMADDGRSPPSAARRAAVAVGHSFGGAVAVNVGVALAGRVAGVCTLSTQSAGCEQRRPAWRRGRSC